MQSSNVDAQAIYQAVSDYYDGWYTPDEKSMERCLHADLAKRGLKVDDTGTQYIIHLTKEVMVEATRQGGGSQSPAEKKNWAITILDCFEQIATVKVASVQYMEYIHLARQNGQWQIVNVIYMNLW